MTVTSSLGKSEVIDVNLVGNPNTGKTTLFNTLTNAHEHVGNWHGVTVEEKTGRYRYQDHEINIVDLPGIYSLSPLSFEEKVATDYIFSHNNRIIINICDASNLQRNLYLTLSLMELGCPIILLVNQIDKKKICKIDFIGLGKALNIKVVYINAGEKSCKKQVSEAIIGLTNDLKNGKKNNYNIPYLKNILNENYDKLKEIDEKIAKNTQNNLNLAQFYKIKLLEDDEDIKNKLEVNENFDCIEEVASSRYNYIYDLMEKFSSKRSHVYGESSLDKILLNRFLALPIFLLILFVCFYLTFFSIGAWLSDGLGFLLDKFVSQPIIDFLIDRCGSGSWLVSLIEVALIGGVGSILTFLPQVALLFFFLSLLEDSGYLSRVAFVFEDILGKVGLSGKSVYTLLMGFGCSTTAVLTARNMEDKNSKIKIGLLTPYMSCSAKFPIYAVLGGAFFGASNIFVIVGLYLLGIVIAITLSYIYEKTFLKSKEQSFILEFPPYRMMSIKRTFSVLWQNVKLFMSRVGSLILAMNVIVWVLSNFTITFKFISSDGVSMLETFGRLLAPLFVPLGFGSWGLVSALIAGIVAKEVVLSSIAMFNGVESHKMIQVSVLSSASAVYFASGSSAISFLVFCLLYLPCISTFSVLLKEIGAKWTFIGVLVEFVVAYLTTFVIYTVGRCFEVFGFWKVFLTILAVLIIVISVVVVVKNCKRGKTCPFKSVCKRKCKR